MLRGLMRSSFVLFLRKSPNRYKIRLILNTYSFSTFSVCLFNYFKKFVVLLIWQLITAAVLFFSFVTKRCPLFEENLGDKDICEPEVHYLFRVNKFFFLQKFFENPPASRENPRSAPAQVKQCKNNNQRLNRSSFTSFLTLNEIFCLKRYKTLFVFLIFSSR